jgi:hypothetical protein
MSDEDLRQLIDRPQVRTRQPHDATILRAARSPTLRNWRYVPAVALAAGLAVLTLGIYLTSSRDDHDIVRSQSSMAAESVSPAVGLSLKAPPGEFRWPVQAGARSYGVVVRDASGIIIWRSEALKTNHVLLDHAFAAGLTPHTYYWSVDVEREEAKLELGPFWFRLVDP